MTGEPGTEVTERWMDEGLDPGPDPFPPQPSSERVDASVRVAMRDGTELVGDLYLPHGPGPFPAILERTPYGAQRAAPVARRFARIGYLYLALDVRGRYRSEGTFVPLDHAAEDGADAIAWLAAHPACNGMVGTRGHSYGGTVQLLAAAERPPALRAMAVGVTPGDPFHDVPFQGGAWDVGDVDWLLSVTGRTDSSDRLLPFEEEEEDDDPDDDEDRPPSLREEHEEKVDEVSRRLTHAALRARPFRDLDLRLGVRCPTFRRWLEHWVLDHWWLDRSVLPKCSSVAVPVLHLTGVWDGNGRGGPTFFRALRERAATPQAREAQRLLVGPWTHDLEAPEVDDLPAADARDVLRGALRDPMEDEVAWFERHLRGIVPRYEPRVEWFVTGLNRWIHLGDWPPETTKRVLHLDPEDRSLGPGPPGGAGFVSYVCDPDDPAPYGPAETEGEREPFDTGRSPVDGRSDVIDFTSPPLEEPLRVLGDVTAEIWWSADARDGDLYLQLVDVYPDGPAVFLTDGILRARFREGFDHETPLTPGEPVRMVVDLWHTGHEFRVGHRVRLRAQPSALDRFDVNPGTGGSLADETECHRAEHRIHGGAGRPSKLVLREVADWEGLG